MKTALLKVFVARHTPFGKPRSVQQGLVLIEKIRTRPGLVRNCKTVWIKALQ
jgi:hypothetical protein